jgi:hypothetical protein
MEMFETIRREYAAGELIHGLARKHGAYRQMVRQALAEALPPERRPRGKSPCWTAEGGQTGSWRFQLLQFDPRQPQDSSNLDVEIASAPVPHSTQSRAASPMTQPLANKKRFLSIGALANPLAGGWQMNAVFFPVRLSRSRLPEPELQFRFRQRPNAPKPPGLTAHQWLPSRSPR